MVVSLLTHGSTCSFFWLLLLITPQKQNVIETLNLSLTGNEEKRNQDVCHRVLCVPLHPVYSLTTHCFRSENKSQQERTDRHKMRKRKIHGGENKTSKPKSYCDFFTCDQKYTEQFQLPEDGRNSFSIFPISGSTNRSMSTRSSTKD